MANPTQSKPIQSKPTLPPILFILLSVGLVFGLSQLWTRCSSTPSAVTIAVAQILHQSQ